VTSYLITAPTQDVVTLDEAKRQLRVTSTSSDELIQAMIDAVVALLDPATSGYLDRALRPQTWEARLPNFPCGEIKLPYPPLMSITSVKYDDLSGVERTLAVTTGYRVIGQGSFSKAAIAPPYLQPWPAARCDFESVRIRFIAGYDADADAGDSLPAAIKQAVHLAVRNLYTLGERSLFESQNTIDGVGEKRWIVSDMASKIIKEATDNLLAPYRVW
jgi:uncharacterized phiE125 gp8 family phage protein